MLSIGMTRKGKTYGGITPVMRNLGKIGGVVLDPQTSYSELLLKCAAYRGKLHHVRYISLGEINKRFGIFNLRGDVRKAVRAPMNIRGIDFLTSPLIYEWMMYSHELVKASDVALYYLPHCFDPNSREFAWMMDRCPEPSLKERWMRTVFWSDRQRLDNLQPAYRLIDNYANDLDFQLLCANDNTSQLLYELIADRKLVIFEGGRADPQTVTMIYSFIIQMMIEFHRQYRIPAMTIVDELCNYGLLTRELAVACAAEVKNGFRPFLLTQTLTGEEEDVQLLLQNVQVMDVYGTVEMETLKRLAYTICTSGFAPDRIQMDGVHKVTLDEKERLCAMALMNLPVGAFARINRGKVKWLKNAKAHVPYSNSSCWEPKRSKILHEMNRFYEAPTPIMPPENVPPVVGRRKPKGRKKS